MITLPSPQIDVVIPAYNAVSTIASAIASIQRQTIQNISIIVVDDGSTDGTLGVVREIAADDPRVRVVSLPNGGIVDALNEGLSHVTAPYVARFDADDIAFETRLERQLDFLDTHPDYVGVGGNVWHIDENGHRRGTRSNFNGDVAPDPFWAPSKEPYLLHPFLLVRTSTLRQIGGYRHVFHAEDTDLYWRLYRLGGLYSLPDKLGEYRIHSASITGASIVNGRISALNSQLAALSAARDSTHQEDLVFPKEMLAVYHERRHIQPMLALWHDRLSPQERGYLEVAVAAKLMELAAYRPYELEMEDCRFVRRAVTRNIHRIKPANIPRLVAKCARTVLRLLRQGHRASAASLVYLR